MYSYRSNKNELENKLSHSLSLRYYKFNMYRGLFLNGNLSYTRRVNSIRSTNIIEGIHQISSLMYTDVPEKSYFGTASVAKQIRKIKITLSGNASLSHYSRIVNDKSPDYNSENYSYTQKRKPVSKTTES